MKVSEMWELLDSTSVVIIVNRKKKMQATMWRADGFAPDEMEKEIVSVKPIENRVLEIEVA